MAANCCPHYNEIAQVLSSKGDLDAVSFELDEIGNCTECTTYKVCSLWIKASLCIGVLPQLNLPNIDLTIDNLDKILGEIAVMMVKSAPSSSTACVDAAQPLPPTHNSSVDH